MVADALNSASEWAVIASVFGGTLVGGVAAWRFLWHAFDHYMQRRHEEWHEELAKETQHEH